MLMQLGNIKDAYYSQFMKYGEAARKTAEAKEELEKKARLYPGQKNEYLEQAATLELRYNELSEQSDKYLEAHSKLVETEVAFENMKVAEQQGDSLREAAKEERKILEVARRISRGDIVPPEDEMKLMQYDFKLYMASKQAGAMAKEHEKDESLWEDEEESSAPGEEEMSPSEYASSVDVPVEGPPLDAEPVDIEIE